MTDDLLTLGSLFAAYSALVLADERDGFPDAPIAADIAARSLDTVLRYQRHGSAPKITTAQLTPAEVVDAALACVEDSCRCWIRDEAPESLALAARALALITRWRGDTHRTLREIN